MECRHASIPSSEAAGATQPLAAECSMRYAPRLPRLQQSITASAVSIGFHMTRAGNQPATLRISQLPTLG